ncbi:carbohydrate ABC transporter permease [Nonomuraea sp. NEAU-A123]|uniref:carbohydrate ABC transporter permease n=1 Tax=Nonomuraea sp. NEAU-A123 TaxID=2839649 RepID=UPI001BE46594|nr:sugar ABC transporter permease [Nonomuraea sp. NEAU-A123]MBT2227884.1 sugar ABC transporter permease [Nonomuraea sp. NEAU-A123]
MLRRSRTSAQVEGRSAYLFLLPWFAGLLLLTGGPILASLALSFTDFDLLTPPSFVGLDNYARMLTDDPHFVNAVRVTLIYVVFSVPLSGAFALLVAVLLNRPMRGTGVYRAAYYLPSLLGGSVAVAILWRQIFGADGLINDGLRHFGIVGPSWISTPQYAIYTLIVLHVWQFGSPMLIFLAGLKQIPAELYDAAAVDGAGRVRAFFRVTLPMLSPIIFFNLVLQTVNAFKAFTPAFIISGGTGGPADSTLFYTLFIYQEGFGNFRMGYASALAWVLLLVTAAFTGLAFRSARYWVHYAD